MSAPAAPAANTTRMGSVSLYVGDLPTDLQNPEDALFNLFNKIGMVVSIKVCRDINSQRSLGYAYVNFQNPQDAETAMKTLNFTEIRSGRLIRVMYSQRDPALRKHGAGNLFIKNLDTSLDTRALYDAFSSFGLILSCKLANDEAGKSRGYGFVHFDKEEAATEAIARVDGTLLGASNVSVTSFRKKSDREHDEEKVFRNLFVKNIGKDITEEDLTKAIEKYGKIESLFVSPHSQHDTKFALASMVSHEDAVTFIEKAHEQSVAGITDGETKLFVCRAVKKRDRLAQRAGAVNNLYQSQGRNIYVKHLEDTINKEQFEEMFARFGTVSSSALMKDPSGNPRGFGFICFEAKEAATAAIRELNGKTLFGKRPLYVSQAMHKDMRHRMLEDQRKNMMAQQQRMSSAMPMYPPYWNAGPFGGRGPMPGMMGPMGGMPFATPPMRGGLRGPPMMGGPMRGGGGGGNFGPRPPYPYGGPKMMMQDPRYPYV